MERLVDPADPSKDCCVSSDSDVQGCDLWSEDCRGGDHLGHLRFDCQRLFDPHAFFLHEMAENCLVNAWIFNFAKMDKH